MLGSTARVGGSLPCVRLAALVAPDHVYRHGERTLDLGFGGEEVRDTSAGRGRPSIDPVVVFKYAPARCPRLPGPAAPALRPAPDRRAHPHRPRAGRRLQRRPAQRGRHRLRPRPPGATRRGRGLPRPGAHLPRHRAVPQGDAPPAGGVEPLFAAVTAWPGRRRLRWRGLPKLNPAALLIAAGQPRKRLLSHRGCGRGRGMRPSTGCGRR